MIELLKELKFTTVVCVDDENAVSPIDSIEALAREFVNAEPRKRRNLAKVDDFFSEPLSIVTKNDDADLQSKQADVRAWFEVQNEDDFNTERLKLASEKLNQGVIAPTATKVRSELHGAGITLHTLSFAEWLQRKDALLAAAAEESKVLLLVDEVNEHEPGVDLNGEGLLADLLVMHHEKVPFVDAIVVTSRCQPDQELEESQKVFDAVTNILVQRHAPRSFKKVFVLSKTRLTDSTFTDSFRFHLNRLEASRLSIALADATKLVLIDALEESLNWLKSVPLMEFHHSVFVSAETEGAAEVDTLVRLASIRQRTALDKLLREDKKVQGYIEAMRRFTPDALGGALSSATPIMLKSLRKEEFERPGTHINLLRIPLACGDVFRFTTLAPGGVVSDIEAMLLVNPCDLVLRKDGARKLRTGLLVPIRKLMRSEVDGVGAELGTAPLGYRLTTGSQPDDIVYHFNNSKIESIPLAVLDLCWLQADGTAVLDSVRLEASMNLLSAPQRMRATELLKRASDGKFINVELWNADLPVSTEMPAVQVQGTEGIAVPATRQHVTYSVQRIWRMAPEYAAAALSTLSQALSRPVFGHDYLQQ